MKSAAVPETAAAAAFARRAARASALARDSIAAQPLAFAAGLYHVQGRVAGAIEGLHARRALSGGLREDAGRLGGLFDEVIRFAAEAGPPGLAADAGSLAGDEAALRARLLAWWDGDRSGGTDYLCRALLRPYAEVLALRAVAPDGPRSAGRCPSCAGAPWVASRREDVGASGSRRLLGCALCGGEWPIGRIICPSCQEGDPAKLPSFQSDRHPAARIEACETCHRYVKSIDLRVEAAALPEVDDLVSLSLDLWAASQGFTRLEPGLIGPL